MMWEAFRLLPSPGSARLTVRKQPCNNRLLDFAGVAELADAPDSKCVLCHIPQFSPTFPDVELASIHAGLVDVLTFPCIPPYRQPNQHQNSTTLRHRVSRSLAVSKGRVHRAVTNQTKER